MAYVQNHKGFGAGALGLFHRRHRGAFRDPVGMRALPLPEMPVRREDLESIYGLLQALEGTLEQMRLDFIEEMIAP